MVEMDDVLARANELYAAKKLNKKMDDIAYVAPEIRPRIQSDQVKCLMQALVEAFNNDKTASVEEAAATEYWGRMHADDHAL